MSGLAPFPAGTADSPAAPECVQRLGYGLRPAKDDDLPQLRLLYADTRADEMANTGWPLALRQAFLDQQFSAQHRHYLQHFADADFLVIEHQGQVQGRYYLLRRAPDHLVVDICLMPAHRGQGIGRALIQDSLDQASALGRGMGLHVVHSNLRARRLYESLGFELCDSTATHHRMRWPRRTPAPS